MKSFHVDEPRGIGKKRIKVSKNDLMQAKDDLTEILLKRKLKEFVKNEMSVLMNEGIYDPGIFKAVFLAGGPGSGKTYVAGGLFGIPNKVNVSAYGLKMVNQDTELETFLKK